MTLWGIVIPYNIVKSSLYPDIMFSIHKLSIPVRRNIVPVDVYTVALK